MNPRLRLRGRKPCGQECGAPRPAPPCGAHRTWTSRPAPTSTSPRPKGDLTSPPHTALRRRRKETRALGGGYRSYYLPSPVRGLLDRDATAHPGPRRGLPWHALLRMSPRVPETQACQPRQESPGSSCLLDTASPGCPGLPAAACSLRQCLLGSASALQLPQTLPPCLAPPGGPSLGSSG